MKHWPFQVIAGPGDRPMIVVQYLNEEKCVRRQKPTSAPPWRTPSSPSLPTSMTPNGKPPKTPAPSPA
ncbi:hypothetical protein EJ110_NYTH05576 [Nymphaea thermarum]|nr:hypothetical protein EJ110_NYTH05576 [Nymphaea thermarum]